MRKIFNTTLLVTVIGLLAIWYFNRLNLAGLLLTLLISLAVGLLDGWRLMRTMAQGVIDNIPADMALARVPRDHVFDGVSIDWHQLDDYACQLEAAGFHHQGDFTLAQKSTTLTGVAVVYVDKTGTILIEIQFIQLGPDAHHGSKANGLHFSINSLIGGRIAVCTTDHVPSGLNYLFRTVSDVLAAYPGETLMVLLDKHRQLLKNVATRTGKQINTGLSMERQILLTRERYGRVVGQLRQMGAYHMISKIDRFEAKPRLNWAAPAATLRDLPLSTLEALENDPLLNSAPPITDLPPPNNPAASGQSTPASATLDQAQAQSPRLALFNRLIGEGDDGSEADPEQVRQDLIAFLQYRARRVAGWFYWIAGLTVINLLVAQAGSQWRFSMGLGFTQLLHEQTRGPQMVAGCVATIALFVAFGLLARKASIPVYAVGISLYALDTLVFVMASNTMGIFIHFLVVFLLYRGLRASRALLRLREMPPQST